MSCILSGATAPGLAGWQPGPKPWPRRPRRLALPAVAALHALVLLALLQAPPWRARLVAPAPVLALLYWVNERPAPSSRTAPPVADMPLPAPRSTQTQRPPMAPLPLPVWSMSSTTDAAETAPARSAGELAERASTALPSAAASPAASTPAVSPAAPPTRKRLAASDVQYLVLPPVQVPRAARRAGESGVVWLRVLVDVNGLPAQVQLHRSSGHARLDEQALWAMRQARFRPQSENGRAIELEVIAPIDYPLE